MYDLNAQRGVQSTQKSKLRERRIKKYINRTINDWHFAFALVSNERQEIIVVVAELAVSHHTCTMPTWQDFLICYSIVQKVSTEAFLKDKNTIRYIMIDETHCINHPTTIEEKRLEFILREWLRRHLIRRLIRRATCFRTSISTGGQKTENTYRVLNK